MIAGIVPAIILFSGRQSSQPNKKDRDMPNKSINSQSVFVINGVEFSVINSVVKHLSAGCEAVYDLELISNSGAIVASIKTIGANIDALFSPGESYNPEKQKEPGIGQIVRFMGDDWRVVYVTPGISGRVRMTGVFVLRNLNKPEIERTVTNPSFFGAPEHLSAAQMRMIEMIKKEHADGFISTDKRDEMIKAVKKPE